MQICSREKYFVMIVGSIKSKFLHYFFSLIGFVVVQSPEMDDRDVFSLQISLNGNDRWRPGLLGKSISSVFSLRG